MAREKDREGKEAERRELGMTVTFSALHYLLQQGLGMQSPFKIMKYDPGSAWPNLGTSEVTLQSQKPGFPLSSE